MADQQAGRTHGKCSRNDVIDGNGQGVDHALLDHHVYHLAACGQEDENGHLGVSAAVKVGENVREHAAIIIAEDIVPPAFPDPFRTLLPSEMEEVAT
ncbi:hypothetical protein FHS92_000213 [Sphingobium subterraneum]|uniref:Uncharacterized protein n=1 Tax=Sphingobium subterraneum TaxID=627688 RepID=A0A841IZ01_9SPHN|nr:hypothetical protein [Sphingobium subterraneum]MBB6122506.1 hypothetical protein [Sphingobium subterraneum]